LNTVQTYIERKRLKDGDRLPPERELAVEPGISTRDLRQTLTQLELDGRLWRVRRNCTILGHPPAMRRPESTAVSRARARVTPWRCALLSNPATGRWSLARYSARLVDDTLSPRAVVRSNRAGKPVAGPLQHRLGASLGRPAVADVWHR
jgi:DNA-binding transcriptional MocR family regulator